MKLKIDSYWLIGSPELDFDPFTYQVISDHMNRQERWTLFNVRLSKVVFTLYWIMKRSVKRCASDWASAHTRDTTSGTVSAPLSSVKHPVSDRFLKRSRPSMNTFAKTEIATKPLIGKFKAIAIRFKPAHCEQI